MQTIRYEKDNAGIVTLTFDEPGSPVNTMSIEWQRDLHVGAGQQRAVLVGQRHLHLHRARAGVDRRRRARHLALELLVLQLDLRHDDGLAGLHEIGVGLRHAHVDAQRIGLR